MASGKDQGRSEPLAEVAPMEGAAAGGARASPSATMVMPAVPAYVLRGVSGAAFGRVFPILGEGVLGRDAQNMVVLDMPGVSRQHLRLTPGRDGLQFEDLGSTNGVLLNETPLRHGHARHGDELGVGSVRLRVVEPGKAGIERDSGRSDGRTGKAAIRNWGFAAAALVALVAGWLWWISG